MIEFKVKIISDETAPGDLRFCASSDDAAGTDHIFAGYGATPYAALHGLIDNCEEAELYRSD